jgi:hypothetical protein
MVKPRIIRSVLLLALIGIIVTALVQPIAGSTMGKGKLMEQKDKMIPCPENKSITQSGMGEREASKSCNKTMTGSMMKEKLSNKSKSITQYGMGEREASKSCNKTMTDSMMKEKLSNKSKSIIQYGMGEREASKSCNKTMTGSMMKEKLSNKSRYNESSSQANLDCARLWLEKAIKLHAMHLENPKSATNESQMEMMDQMMQAKKYLAGGKMDMATMNKVADNESTGKLKETLGNISAEKSEQSENYSSSKC